MGKKKPKSSTSFSKSLDVSNSNSSFGDQSVLSEESFVKGDTSCKQFKVLLCDKVEDKEKYITLTKNCSYKNIAFIHPSVHESTFVIVEGSDVCSVVLALPLKTVRKASIVLLRNVGFKHEEFVSVHPFEGEGYEAEEVFVTLPLEFQRNPDIIKQLIRNRLSNAYIWPSLKFNLELFDVKYDFIISDVKSAGTISQRNVFRNDFLNVSSLCTPNQSINFETKNKVDSQSELQLASAFSSIKLEDSLTENRTSSSIHSRIADDPKTVIPNFYTINYKTVITFCDNPVEKKNLSPLFQHIGGYKEQITSIQRYINGFLKLEKATENPSMLLLTGPSGTGKTNLLKAILNEYNSCTEEIDKETFYTYLIEKSSDVLLSLKEKLKTLKERSRSLLLIDEFHELYSPVSGSKSRHEYDLLLNLIYTCGTNILIIGTVPVDFQCEKKLLDTFSVKKIKFSLPSVLEREEIFSKILNGMKHNLSSCQVKECAVFTEGMTPREIFKALKYSSVILSAIRLKNWSKEGNNSPDESVITLADVKFALMKRKSNIMSSDLKKEKVNWSDIGGMHSIKETLKKEIQLLQMPAELMRNFNYTPNHGILLYGPPGCSKTMIAKALATECNCNFISKKASDLLNMYVGESEKAVAELFCKAKEKAPCIIFLDEIDAIASDRYSSASASGVGNRVVNTLLQELDGFEDLKGVIVVAATNRPNIIDSALLRSGRLGKHIYIPLPDSGSRHEIFRLSMKRRSVGSSVDFDTLVNRTEGYTGAEIVHLCNEAAMQVITKNPELCVFEMNHFEKALEAVPPRTSKQLIKFYEDFSITSK